MRFTLKKGLIATSLALAFSPLGSAQAADVISFDPDGAGALSPFDIISFDWSVGNALADQVHVTPAGSSYNLYFHSALGGFHDGAGDAADATLFTGMNGSFEITVIGKISEQVSGFSSSVSNVLGFEANRKVQTNTLNFAIGGGDSFIRVLFDNVIGDGSKASSINGTGYDDGIRILDAALASLSGTFSSKQEFIDNNANNVFDAGDTALTSSTDTSLITRPSNILLDQASTDEWGGQLTVLGDGSTTITANISFFDPNFFKTALQQITNDLNFTTETNLPFNETNPSKCFDTDNTIAGGGVVGLLPGAGGCDPLGGLLLGALNGGFLGGPLLSGNYGPDLLLQLDASNSFKRAVPEPSMLALLGIGLMGIAISRRKGTT